MLVYWLKQMQVDVIIDSVLGAPHGNWEGLSRGELALVFIAYVVMNCTHFLSPVEAMGYSTPCQLESSTG